MCLYDGGAILLEKQGASTTATYTYGNALVRKDGEFPLFDGQGSERTITNASQSVTGTLVSSAFGQTVATTGSSTSAYQYAATSGYRNDGDAGLMHVGCRYYDTQVGRFVSRDTYLDQKPYLYCEHDPVNATDPSGHNIMPNRQLPDFRDWADKLNVWSNGLLKAGAATIGIATLCPEVPPVTVIVAGAGLVEFGAGAWGKVIVGAARLVQSVFK